MEKVVGNCFISFMYEVWNGLVGIMVVIIIFCGFFNGFYCV